MTEYLKNLMLLKNDRRGVTAMEYGIIAALVAVVIIVGVSMVGTSLLATFNNIGTQLGGGGTATP